MVAFTAMSQYKKLLVTTDYSEGAQAAVVEGAELARLLDAKVVLAYVVQDRLPPMMIGAGLHWQDIVEKHEAAAMKALNECAEAHFAGIEVETVVRVGIPADSILKLAEELEVDLIIMASHGYGLVGKIVLGSTTERVLKRASCPVLVVRPRD